MKKCTRCQEFKDESEFYKVRTNTDGLHKHCKACVSEQKKAEYAANPEFYKQRSREYRSSHREQIKQYKHRVYKPKTRTRQDDNIKKEKTRERRKIWGINNRERVNELHRQAYHRRKEINPNYHINRRREWNKKHPEKLLIITHRRRARVLQAEGSFTVEEWLRLCQDFDNKCLACGKSEKLTIDHIIPVSKGGSNYISNIQPLCKTCNLSKNNKAIDYRPFIPEWIRN